MDPNIAQLKRISRLRKLCIFERAFASAVIKKSTEIASVKKDERAR